MLATLLLAAASLAAADLETLYRARPGVSRRASSFDTSGANRDAFTLKPGEKRTLAQLRGSGVIRHIWFTMASEDQEYLRRTVLRFYWDGETEPSVHLPIGDLFGLGHGVVTDISSAPLTVVRSTITSDPAGRGGMNLFFPMPFATEARIEAENQSSRDLQALYFYIDYDQQPLSAADDLRFHAAWRAEMLRAPERVNPNLTAKDNYTVLEARGRGHYVGCVLSVDSRGAEPGKWWEGDDMIFVDGDSWPPRIHGTGTEDYFGFAYGFRKLVSNPYHGITLLEKRPGIDTRFYDGRYTAYRFHIADPVAFRSRIRVTLEHGHANDATVRYASTAYWYQTEPHVPAPALPPPGERTWK